MPALQRSDALALDLPFMDDAHREFVELLAAVASSPDDTLPAAWQTAARAARTRRPPPARGTPSAPELA